MSDRDPLKNAELDPLRPLNNVLWGYVRDEAARGLRVWRKFWCRLAVRLREMTVR